MIHKENFSLNYMNCSHCDNTFKLCFTCKECMNQICLDGLKEIINHEREYSLKFLINFFNENNFIDVYYMIQRILIK